MRSGIERIDLFPKLADSVGVSVGKTNYCVRALVEARLLKVENFRCSHNKLAYAC